jgi:transcriptional regulator with XRE-family HTH domain
MEQANTNFIAIYDWLRKHKGLKDRLSLSRATGISQNTITNIMNGKTSVSEITMKKLNDAYNGIFNMQFLRGADREHMFSPDFKEPITPKENIPGWADNLIEIMSKQIAENEILHKQLTDALAQVNSLRAELATAIRGQYPIQSPSDLLAADPRPLENHS